jgi:hypothetical protein
MGMAGWNEAGIMTQATCIQAMEKKILRRIGAFTSKARSENSEWSFGYLGRDTLFAFNFLRHLFAPPFLLFRTLSINPYNLILD